MKPRKHGWADKAAPYKSWRYQWNVSGVHDVDQIEWRGDYPVAVLELTTNPTIDQKVKDRVAHRLWYEFSGKKLRHVAKALGVPFYIVLMDFNVEEITVCHQTSPESGWVDMPRDVYRHWLSSLQPLRSTKDTSDTKTTNSQ
jgi:hypothetical protein|tara:strand:+ start:1094 stop:1519 length:426 start_codon:yes stop_codon:yes gene_type:complete